MALGVLLSGEHPTLPLAELRALLAVAGHDGPESLTARIARVPDDAVPVLPRMAMAHAWGTLVGAWPATAEGLAAAAGAVQAAAAGQVGVTSDGRGAAGAGDAPRSVAVRALRIGDPEAGPGWDRDHVARTLGAALAAAGLPIDLRRPDETWYAWFDGDRLVVGIQAGKTDRRRFEARHGELRAHFSPVTLHPRTAAALVHLARVPPGGTLYDPFCGTGGIVLEAALDGYHAVGSDIDAWMVQGTLQTLADAGPEPLDGVAFVADVGDAPGLVGTVDGIVTDLPYGRAASTRREDVRTLYERAYDAFARLLAPGRHAVVGCGDAALLPDPEAHGLEAVEGHDQFVHRSLTRHFAVVKRREGVGSPQ